MLDVHFPMRPLWIKAALLLAGVWLVVGGAVYFARSAKATPESLLKYVQTHPVESRPAKERAKVIEGVAGRLNQLAYEERREFRMGRKMDGFFRDLSPEEQTRFLDLTLPTGFKQMMNSLNNMDPAKRKVVVTKALEEMRKAEGEGSPSGALGDDKTAQKIIEQGLKSFYSEASAETKMDVAPLIEQMQKNMQGGR